MELIKKGNCELQDINSKSQEINSIIKIFHNFEFTSRNSDFLTIELKTKAIATFYLAILILLPNFEFAITFF